MDDEGIQENLRWIERLERWNKSGELLKRLVLAVERLRNARSYWESWVWISYS